MKLFSTHDIGKTNSHVKWDCTIKVPKDELARELDRCAGLMPIMTKRKLARHLGITGWTVSKIDREQGLVTLAPKPNLVVDIGVQYAMDLNFNISTRTAVRSMGVDDGVSNPVAGTVSSTAGSTNRRIVLFDSTPSRTASVMTVAGTFTQATVAFTMKRLFLSRAAAGTTDASNDLYSMTNVFTMDLSVFSTWSQTFTATVTGTGS